VNSRARLWAGAFLLLSLCGWVPLGWGSKPETQLAMVRPPTRLSLVHKYAGPSQRVFHVPHHAEGWKQAGLAKVRGVTIGPIESYLQPGRGYGSEPFAATLDEVVRLGANWISLTAFARVWDKTSVGLDLSFEQPHLVTKEAVMRAVQLAHARGLRVLFVPHLWLESGEWRAEMAPGDPARQARFEENYSKFVLFWAQVAEHSGIDMFSVGVELRSWVCTSQAASFVDLIHAVRNVYRGPLTYASNWDDAEDTVIWGELDVIGINAFYPLHWEDDASYAQVEAGGYRVRDQVQALARRYERSVLFTEFGYTTRHNTEIKPWLWPEQLGEVTADQAAQERAYEALLGAMSDVPGFAGTLVWRMYSDVADLSQEPDWGFSPWGKLAERQLRRLYLRDAMRQSLR
jgi:hypothetical protein